MPSVSEVIEKCKAAGLEVRRNPGSFGGGAHTLWDIVDPSTGTVLTGISGHAGKQGGDLNWHWNIRRVLRRAGFQIDFGAERKKKNRSIRQVGRKPAAIDLEALKKAQDQAAAAGERIPTLDDLEGTHEFLRRRKGVGRTFYSDEAQDEVISEMAPKAESSRINYTKQRLEKFFEKHDEALKERGRQRRPGGGKGGVSPIVEFVEIALEEVAPTRNLRAWKSTSGGQQAIYTFLRGNSLSIWAINLIEATMDHIEGLKWKEIDETRIKPKETAATPQVQIPKPAPEPTDSIPQVWKVVPETQDVEATLAMLGEFEAKLHALETALNKLEASVDALYATSAPATLEVREANPIAEQYASVLLDLLKNFNVEQQGNAMLDMIFARLDKLAGF